MGMGGKPLELGRRMKPFTVRVVEHRNSLPKEVVESLYPWSPQQNISLSDLLYLSLL